MKPGFINIKIISIRKLFLHFMNESHESLCCVLGGGTEPAEDVSCIR